MNQFRTATHELRYQMIDLLRDVAYYQAERMIELVQLALREPGQDSEGTVWSHYEHKDVLQQLPKLLRYVAYHIRHLMRCYDLLWILGRDDERPTSQYPEHGMRVLAELAGYHLDRPIIFQEAAVDAAKRWLLQAGVHQHVHSPLEVLDALLAKTGYSEYSDGRQIYMRGFVVTYEVMSNLRQRAFDIIEQCALSKEVRVITRAIKSLSNALRPPLPYFNMVITEELRSQWHPEESLVMEIIARVIDHSTHPVVRLRCIEALVWHTRYSSSEALRLKAREIIGQVPETFELQLVKVLGFGHGMIWILEGVDNSEEEFVRRDEQRVRYCHGTQLDFCRTWRRLMSVNASR